MLCPFQSLKFDSISVQHVVYKFQVVGMICWPLLEFPVSWWWSSQLSWIWLIPSQKHFDVWRINLYFFEEESIGKYKRIGSWMLKEIAIGSHSTIVGSLSQFIYWKFCFAQAYLRLCFVPIFRFLFRQRFELVSPVKWKPRVNPVHYNLQANLASALLIMVWQKQGLHQSRAFRVV